MKRRQGARAHPADENYREAGMEDLTARWLPLEMQGKMKRASAERLPLA